MEGLPEEFETKKKEEKPRDLEKEIKEMKIKKINRLTTQYLQDYTVFNYKIDKVLN